MLMLLLRYNTTTTMCDEINKAGIFHDNNTRIVLPNLIHVTRSVHSGWILLEFILI
jgi:hypothetical protein